MEARKIKIKKGLDIPITGSPNQVISETKHSGTVAIVGTDYVGIKPHLAVSIGDSVKLGDLIFTDKKRPAIRYTSPGAGKVIEINRGEKRMLLSVVIALEGNDEIHVFLTSHLLYGSGSRIITFSSKKPLSIIYKEIGTMRIRLI